MQLVRMVLLVALGINSLVSYGAETTRTEKLNKLAQYEEMAEVTKRYKDLCINEINKTNPLKIAKDNPEYFGGITPWSKYWPDVEMIYGEYIKSACVYLDEEKVLAKFISVYDKEMSDEALDGIIEFYESAAGKEYLKAISHGKERMQKYYAEAATPVFEKAMKKYTEELGALIRKCRCERNK